MNKGQIFILLLFCITLTIGAQPSTGSKLVISCDNAYECYFNGKLMGSGNDWTKPQSYNLSLQNGKNVIAIKGIDAGGIAAMLADLTVNNVKIGSNATWKVNTADQNGWNTVNFNDGGWGYAKEYGAYGVTPWNQNAAGMPANTSAKWIWSGNNDLDDTVFFRYSIYVNEGSMTISCDNSYELYVNGKLLGSGNDWSKAQTYALNLQRGKNVIAIKGIDAGGIAALIADISLTGSKIGSSATWKINTTEQSGWNTVNFNDGGWGYAKEYGSYGVTPWNQNAAGMPANTSAKWIWSGNNDLDDTVFVRCTINLN